MDSRRQLPGSDGVVRTAADGLLSGDSGGEGRRKGNLRLPGDLHWYVAICSRAITELAEPVFAPAIHCAVHRDSTRGLPHTHGSNRGEGESARDGDGLPSTRDVDAALP